MLSAQVPQGFPGFPGTAARTCASRSQTGTLPSLALQLLFYREMVGVKAIDSYHFTVFSSDVKKFSVLQQLHRSSTA